MTLLQMAERKNAHICLYPHVGSWIERIEDGVRLCAKADHPRLRAVFCGFHWFAKDGKNLPARIREAAPFLRSVNMCGSRGPGPIFNKTIEPLGYGELDNFALLALLRKNGYTGRIGFQGYSIGGDVYTHLKHSLAVYRDMEDRLNRHPNWADLFGE